MIDPEGDFVSLAGPFGHVVIDGAAYSPLEIKTRTGTLTNRTVIGATALPPLR